MITSTLPPDVERTEDTTIKYIAQGPITFKRFLEMFGPKDYVELIDGCIVEKSMVGWDHEDLLGWITTVAKIYVGDHDLGVVAGSRTAVRISPLGSRLPDFFFVSRSRQSIIHQNAVMEAPDLVIEARSPSTTKVEAVEMESDYLSIGVQEIVLIDPKRKHVRVNRLQSDGSYIAEELDAGNLHLQTVPGLWFDLQWLFNSERPGYRQAVNLIEHGPIN